MTEYQRPSFTVKTGGRRPEECGPPHRWGKDDKCVMCGSPKYDAYVATWPMFGAAPGAGFRCVNCDRPRQGDELRCPVCFPATPTEETPDDE